MALLGQQVADRLWLWYYVCCSILDQRLLMYISTVVGGQVISSMLTQIVFWFLQFIQGAKHVVAADNSSCNFRTLYVFNLYFSLHLMLRKHPPSWTTLGHPCRLQSAMHWLISFDQGAASPVVTSCTGLLCTQVWCWHLYGFHAHIFGTVRHVFCLLTSIWRQMHE